MRTSGSKWITGSLVAVIGMGATLAQASIIDSSDVTIGSTTYSTFVDQSTGLTWLDLDIFFGSSKSYNDIVTDMAGSQFHMATASDLATLQTSIPAVTANFAAELPILGGSSSRNLIWGIYDDGTVGDGISWSWKFSTDMAWNSTANTMASADPLSIGSDLGAWVVSNQAIPEPATFAFVGLFGGGMLFVRRILMM